MFYQKSTVTLLISLILLTGCSEAIEQRLAPDPQLEAQQKERSASEETPTNDSPSEEPEQTTNTPENSPSPQLSENLPNQIPIYSNAQVISEQIDPENKSGKIRFNSDDRANVITQFYEQELSDNNWQVVAPFSATNLGRSTLTAESNQLQLSVTVAEASDGEDKRQIVLQYQPLSESASSPTTTFTDLEETPDPLENYVQEVAQLAILSPIEPETQTLAPNETMTRLTFARWLFKANNRFYRDRPSQQIRPVSQAETPAFPDIPPSDPDFPMIQGLAEAGIIPSRLTGEATSAQFRPDAVLTRETLLLWKLPLDTRSNLPSVDVTTVKETWGFQDAGKIDSKALGAIVADFAKGEQSNIRRLYGYTQLLQPEKPVTRAEAAAALWSFGTQGEMITAKELTSD